MKFLESIKALLNNQSVRKGAIEVLVVVAAAVAGAVLTDKMAAPAVVETIDVTEVL